MKYIDIVNGPQRVSTIIQGCMRMPSLSAGQAAEVIRTAFACGINFFDHADIYGGGECERLFGDVLRADPSLRARMLIQTKCGIRKGCYDFSRQHIMEAAEGSLRRLGVETLGQARAHQRDGLVVRQRAAVEPRPFQRLENLPSEQVSVLSEDPGTVQKHLRIEAVQDLPHVKYDVSNHTTLSGASQNSRLHSAMH